MRESTRRQILADLGIVQWRLRVAEGEVSHHAPAADGAPAADVKPPPRAATPSATLPDTNAAPAPPDAAPSETETVAEPRAVPPQAGEPAGEPEPQTPWSALSLAVGGVVLIIDGEHSQRDLRLAMDILAAACGDWSGKPSSRRFDWPPGGAARAAAGGAAAAQRALAAFVDKDLTDYQGRLLVCTEPLAELVPEPSASCRRLVIPPLHTLGRDADAKRALWEALAGTKQ